MKTCRRCGETKALADFNKRTRGVDGLQARCRSCQSELYQSNREQHGINIRKNTARYRERNRLVVYAHLRDHPCVDCGESDPVVLDFDHLGDKTDAISRMIGWGVSVARLTAEMAKCEVVCANCHRRRTARRAGWWRTTQEAPA